MWHTAPRAVAASLAWAPAWPEATLGRLTLVAGLAALDAIADPAVSLKWPNDVVRGEGKAGGILTEHDRGVVVTGLGLNLYWPEPPTGVVALWEHDPGAEAAADLATTWALRLLQRAAAGPAAWGRDEYRSRCATLGSAVTWEPDGAGVARDVARDGSLLVDTGRGVVSLDSGAVRTVRSEGGDGGAATLRRGGMQ